MMSESGKGITSWCRVVIGAALLIFLTAGQVAPAAARGWRGGLDQRIAQADQARISSEQAASIAGTTTKGRVLDVTYANGVYRVRVLQDDGRVRTVRVDANTGRVI